MGRVGVAWSQKPYQCIVFAEQAVALLNELPTHKKQALLARAREELEKEGRPTPMQVRLCALVHGSACVEL